MRDAPPRPSSSAQRSSRSLPSPALLQPWLAVLAALALLACLRALLLPPWPRAQPLDAAALQRLLRDAGLEPQSLPSRPPLRSAEEAWSTGLAWRLEPAAELRLAMIHGRSSPHFQVARLTSRFPDLSLRQRRLLTSQPGVAAGRIQGRDALQTCLVPQGPGPARPAVTTEALSAAIDQQPAALGDRLLSLIGVRPHRDVRCLLVTLQSATAAPLPPRLWQQLLPALQGFEQSQQRPQTSAG